MKECIERAEVIRICERLRDALLSADKKTELEIDSIAELLG